VDAVQCAVAVQEAIAKENADRPAGEQMRFRIGIHVGDIMVQGDNLFGDAVNIAARLEALAEPGGICVSGVVQDHIGTKLPLAFADLGPQQVKNITQPIRAYRMRADISPTDTPVVGTSLPLPDKPSIAVLPFANMSGDPEQEYFADGMVEEIITALSRIRWLFVIARNSSFTYKGKAVDVKQIGRELGVRYVLEGSVRKARQRVRITAQLIDAESGTHLWADSFDGSLEDVFDLQGEVAIAVAGVIEPTLQSAEVRRSAGRSINNLTAYDLFLRALGSYPSLSREGVGSALELLERGLALDPTYAPALSLAARCHLRFYLDGWATNSEMERAQASDLARRALRMARDDPVVLADAAYVLAELGENIEAMMAFIDRALALNPSYAHGWFTSGALRVHAGELDRAIEHVETSLRLSPREHLGAPFSVIGSAHFFAGRFEEAVQKLLVAIQEHPVHPWPFRFLASCYAHMGRLGEARLIVERLRAFTPVVVPNHVPWGKPEDRELLMSGLRLAAGETT
jgi:adenylate cyclase